MTTRVCLSSSGRLRHRPGHASYVDYIDSLLDGVRFHDAVSDVRAHPAILTTYRVVSRQALVSYRGNRYSVPPELVSAQVTVTHVLGCITIADTGWQMYAGISM